MSTGRKIKMNRSTKSRLISVFKKISLTHDYFFYVTQSLDLCGFYIDARYCDQHLQNVFSVAVPVPIIRHCREMSDRICCGLSWTVYYVKFYCRRQIKISRLIKRSIQVNDHLNGEVCVSLCAVVCCMDCVLLAQYDEPILQIWPLQLATGTIIVLNNRGNR